MGEIERISTDTPWEPAAGYSRLVRAGDYVFVSGTTATDERGSIVGLGQMYVQARQALSNIRRALERVGLSMAHVVRTRMFVTDIGRFADAARAHREFFADTPPASSMVEVRHLVNSQMLIEIEADAYIHAPVPAAPPAEMERPAPPAPPPMPKMEQAPRPAAAPKPKARAKKPAPKKRQSGKRKSGAKPKRRRR